MVSFFKQLWAGFLAWYEEWLNPDPQGLGGPRITPAQSLPYAVAAILVILVILMMIAA